MSYVTTLIVASNYLTDDEVKFIQQKAAENNRYRGTLAKPSHEVFGGGKCPEAKVWLGAFNHLDVEGFIADLRERRFLAGIYVMAFTDGEYVKTYMQDAPVDPRDTGGVTHYLDVVRIEEAS